jgi:hypothetical protein
MAEKIDPLKIAKSSRDLDVNGLVKFFYGHGSKFWSWGSQNFVNVKNRGLQFKVNGHHHKGHVYLFVNGLDLFDIYLTSTHGNIKEKIEDVYLEDLFDVLDKKIEWIPIYED